MAEDGYRFSGGGAGGAGSGTSLPSQTGNSGKVLSTDGTSPVWAAAGAPLPLSRPGNRWVALGDSITKGSQDNVNAANGESWPLYASLMSQQRLHLVRNAGIAGNKTQDMIDRFDADVTPWAPNLVTLLAGTNDYPNGVSLATFKANIKTLVGKIVALGAKPALATLPPRDAGGYGPTIVAWNAWIRQYAEANGLSVLDFYRTLTDPANGHYLAAYYSDGIHPSAGAGAAALGEVAATVLAASVPNNAPLLPVDSTDTTNDILAGAGLFLTASGGLGTGWTPGSAPTGVTKSLVSDSAVAGGMQRIAAVAASGLYVFKTSSAAGWSVGDTVRLVGVVTSDGGTPFTVKGIFTGAATGCRPVDTATRAVTRGVFSQDFVIPAGTTAVGMQCEVGSGAGFTGTVDFGQLAVYNLTTMGTLT